MPVVVRHRKDRITWRRAWFPTWYGFAPNEKAWFSAWREHQMYPDYPTTAAHTAAYRPEANGDKGSPFIIVTLNEAIDDKYNDAEVIALLAHEACHVVSIIMEYAGEIKPGEETVAYGVQCITLELWDAYEASGRRKPKT